MALSSSYGVWARPIIVAGAFISWVYVSRNDQTSYALSWKSCVTVLATCSTAFVAVLYRFQDKLLYQPRALPQHVKPSQNPPGYRSPADFNMQYVDVRLTTSDGLKLAAWMIRQPDSKSAPTLVFFHANAGNMGFRLPNIFQIYQAAKMNIFVLSYRGYGDSEGSPNEAGLMIDADAVMNHILYERDDIDPKKVFLFGRSLGGAVAIYAASKYNDKIRGTIIENTFTNIPDMVDSVFPILAPLKPYVLRIDWPSDKRIGSISHPLLLVSGRLDEIVPCVQMDKLYEKAGNSKEKELYKIADGTHNDTWIKGGDQYVMKIREFISNHS